MTYDKLLEEARSENIEVIDNCKLRGLKGLYIDNIISLSEDINCHREKSAF
jgi:hypothetical protein